MSGYNTSLPFSNNFLLKEEFNHLKCQEFLSCLFRPENPNKAVIALSAAAVQVNNNKQLQYR